MTTSRLVSLQSVSCKYVAFKYQGPFWDLFFVVVVDFDLGFVFMLNKARIATFQPSLLTLDFPNALTSNRSHSFGLS